LQLLAFTAIGDRSRRHSGNYSKEYDANHSKARVRITAYPLDRGWLTGARTVLSQLAGVEALAPIPARHCRQAQRRLR
jgi:hypothetical protein